MLSPTCLPSKGDRPRDGVTYTRIVIPTGGEQRSAYSSCKVNTDSWGQPCPQHAAETRRASCLTGNTTKEPWDREVTRSPTEVLKGQVMGHRAGGGGTRTSHDVRHVSTPFIRPSKNIRHSSVRHFRKANHDVTFAGKSRVPRLWPERLIRELVMMVTVLTEILYFVKLPPSHSRQGKRPT